MSRSSSTNNEHHQGGAAYTRQAVILRKNLVEWDAMLRNPRGEDWPTMLGRLNAALNQSANMDTNIDDVMEHFVYLPKQPTANPQDIPFFLSTRLDTSTTETAAPAGNKMPQEEEDTAPPPFSGDPVQQLSTFENEAARLAEEYYKNMVKF